MFPFIWHSRKQKNRVTADQSFPGVRGGGEVGGERRLTTKGLKGISDGVRNV